jgi:hypothetical protein
MGPGEKAPPQRGSPRSKTFSNRRTFRALPAAPRPALQPYGPRYPYLA